MKRKWAVGVGVFQIGMLIGIVSVIADYIGFGGPYIMFGPKQIVGTAVGVIIATIGLIYALRARL